jgi:hypothetical protein
MRHIRVFHVGAADEPRQQPAAQVTSLAVFDFGDFRAEVGEKESGERPLNFLRDLDNSDSLQWLAHKSASSASREDSTADEHSTS